ncbi:uncharacterized protein LOC109864245 [Pseudomyrmex gracilis]|uniref:uncharacterized protein LOC109864245 n=1 Tax=Pseudomyrmex gracilis TaxID=219809 RepID=UPI000994C9D9|nr:uncharacterized protein LOC109864245 [Pseudomyrmex gracilis]
MKGLYSVIAIVFLAYWTATTATSTEKKRDKFPRKCKWNTNETIHLAHETDCGSFYKCYPPDGMRRIPCPLDQLGRPLHFNMFLQVCDWQPDAGCLYCPSNGYPLKLPRGDSCRKYYKCVNGKKKPYKCRPGKCFSRTCQACVKNRRGGKCKK